MCVVNRKLVNKLDLTWKQSFLISIIILRITRNKTWPSAQWQCCYAECYSFWVSHLVSVITVPFMLSVFILNVIMFSVIMQSVIMLNVIMLSVGARTQDLYLYYRLFPLSLPVSYFVETKSGTHPVDYFSGATALSITTFSIKGWYVTFSITTQT